MGAGGRRAPAPSHQVPSPSSHPPPPPGQLCLRCHLQEARRPLFPDLLRRLWDESLNPSRVAGGGGWSRSMHPAPSSSQKTQGPGEGRGKTARPCLLAALSLPPAVPGSRRLTRAPRRRRGGLRAPGRVPVVTPARVCPIHPPRRPWTSDREPGPSSVRRVVPGHARGWGRVSAPTHRPPGSASRHGRGPGPEKEGRPTLTAGAPSGTGGLPSPLRAGVRVTDVRRGPKPSGGWEKQRMGHQKSGNPHILFWSLQFISELGEKPRPETKSCFGSGLSF